MNGNQNNYVGIAAAGCAVREPDGLGIGDGHADAGGQGAARRVCVATGFEYRDEFIHTLASGQVVMYPTWLGGKVVVQFLSRNEALNYVDAKRALETVLLAEESFSRAEKRGGAHEWQGAR